MQARFHDDPAAGDQVVKPAYQQLMHIIAPSMKLPLLDVGGSIYHSSQSGRATTLSGPTLAMLVMLKSCLALGLRDEASVLLETTLPTLPQSGDDFWKSWRGVFNVISSLAKILEWFHHPQLIAILSPFITHAVQCAATYMVASSPKAPSSWTREPDVRRRTYCNCGPFCGVYRIPGTGRDGSLGTSSAGTFTRWSGFT